MGQRFSGERVTRRVRYVLNRAQPAAGADWSIPIPGGYTYELLAIYAQLVTDATAPTRTPILAVAAEGQTIFAAPPVAAIAASLTTRLSWAPRVSALAVGNAQVIPLPDLTLEGGATLTVTTGNLVAGDQWSAPQVYLVQQTLGGGPIDLEDLGLAVVELVSAAAG